MQHQALFENHQLNYDEVVRRLEHWSNTKVDHVQALSAIRTLTQLLAINRNNLHFERRDA